MWYLKGNLYSLDECLAEGVALLAGGNVLFSSQIPSTFNNQKCPCSVKKSGNVSVDEVIVKLDSDSYL